MTDALDRDLDVLWKAMHRRYGAGSGRVGRVTLSGLDQRQREALADLLRERELRPPDTHVPTAKVAAALRVDEDGLRDLVEARLGPAGNRSAARDAAARARADAREELTRHAGGDPAIQRWAHRQAVGTGETLTGRVALAASVLDVVNQPRPQLVALPVVAAEHFGDPHALDHDQPAGRMLAGALAERAGLPALDARTRRRLLREVGVVADELSSTVAAYQLPLATHHPLAAALLGPEPAALTLGQLLRHPLELTGTARVRIVENPAVLTTAALRGLPTAMVCTSGMPSVAALELISQLRDHGCQLHAHADFDAAGLTIVSQLTTIGAAPWKMDVEHYHRAAARSTCPLEVEAVEVSWAPGLAEVMNADGRVGFEEHLLDALLDPDQ
jgi:uncharacterized protein (TIGR02679 family)